VTARPPIDNWSEGSGAKGISCMHPQTSRCRRARGIFTTAGRTGYEHLERVDAMFQAIIGLFDAPRRYLFEDYWGTRVL